MPYPILAGRARRGAVRAALAAVLALPAVTVAQAPAPGPVPPAPAAAFPDTPLGRLGRELVAVVDAGDSAAIARFVADHLGQDVRGRSPATLSRMLLLAHEQSGGLTVERVRSLDDGVIHALTRARNGRRWLGLELVPAPSDSARVADLGLFPMDDPGPTHPPAPWAAGPLGDAQLAAVIESHVRAAADSDRFSGVVLVAHGDSVLSEIAVGFADRARRRPVTAATRFPTYSVGKMFTGVAIAQLVEQGKLRWDDTLARVVPDYPNLEAARRITIRQLLTHTAGVPEPFASPSFRASTRPITEGELLPTFADAPLEMEPGTGFRYSNGNYAALAAVVERVSGLPFESYLRLHVWGPAGMRGARHPAWSGMDDVAVGFARFSQDDPLGLEPRRAETAPAEPYRGAVHGFGMGAFTARDLFRFTRALRDRKLLGAAMVDSVTTGHVDVQPGAPVRYGFGFYEQRWGSARIVGHPGSNPNTGHDADVEMLWDGDWTVVVLSNYDAPAGMQLEMPILQLLMARQGADGR